MINSTVFAGSEVAMQGAHYDVCKLFKHPKYENNTEQDYFWDIGILLLSRHIKLSRRVEIATIAPTSKWRNVRNTMTIAGFGTTDVSLQDYYRKWKCILV